MEPIVQALEGWPLAVALRKSVWVYPLVNAGHILGIALLVGPILVMDLRLLGVWRTQIMARPLSLVLIPVAATGFCIATVTGVLLFVSRAADYTWHPVFLIKLAVIFAAVVNLALLHRHHAWHEIARTETIGPRVRFAATVSLLLWISALLLGRLVGYR